MTIIWKQLFASHVVSSRREKEKNTPNDEILTSLCPFPPSRTMLNFCPKGGLEHLPRRHCASAFIVWSLHQVTVNFMIVMSYDLVPTLKSRNSKLCHGWKGEGEVVKSNATRKESMKGPWRFATDCRWSF